MRTLRIHLLVVVLLAACGSPVPSASPLPATNPPSPAATFASTPAGAETPDASPRASIESVVAAMQVAVLAGGRAAYVDLVDASDPVFRIEHTRWVDDWAGPKPVAEFSLELAPPEITDSTATGKLTMTWRHEGEPAPRMATFVGTFTRDAGGWRYAGEAWSSTEVPHFVIRVAPGLESATPDIAAELPRIYDGVTRALGHVPDADLEIKVYTDPPSLVANTLLSLPDIDGWNEPGEALKLQVGTGRELPPVIAHELVHFIVFERAGTQRSRMPWWLDEGIATLVGTGLDGGDGFNEARLGMVVDWAADDDLAPWEDMAVFEETPVEIWDHVYAQGYAMALFVTEEFGEDRRNAWLAAMATEMDIGEATEAALGRSFDRLDRGFRAWLARQR